MPKKILIIDDEPMLLAALRVRLSAAGYHVHVEPAGGPGLARAKEWEPDMVLLDIRMPGIDGLEVCRRIKADPLLSHIPVVMMSANVQDAAHAAARDAGAVHFLTKPFTADAIRTVTESVLAPHKLTPR